MFPRVYTHKGCDSCRKATRWLTGNGIAFEEIPIREHPPRPAELRSMLAFVDGQLRRLFNTSGQDYRARGLKDELPAMGEDEAIALLAANGNLVKRPFLLADGFGLVGFREEEWSRQFCP